MCTNKTRNVILVIMVSLVSCLLNYSKMSATRKVIISNVIYTVIFIGVAFYLSAMRFTRNDAPGNGMAAGLTFLYTFFLLAVLATILVIYNLVISRKVKRLGLTLFSFFPLVAPVVVFGYSFLGIGSPREASIEEQSHKFSIECVTRSEIPFVYFSMRSSSGGGSSRMQPDQLNDTTFIYKASSAIFYEVNRRFQLKWDNYESTPFELPIAYKPKKTPFTPWQKLMAIDTLKRDTVFFDYRYKVEK